MRERENVIFSLMCATALAWHSPGPAGAGQPCPQVSGAKGAASSRQPGIARHCRAGASEYRLADDTRHPSSLPGNPSIPPATTKRATRYRTVVSAIAQAQGVEPELLHAVITAELGYNPSALSHKGAVGLRQLMPGTAAQYGVTNSSDPAQNSNAGMQHLRYLPDKFDNDLTLALAAYNAGEQAVSQYGNRIPTYPETRAYVQRMLAYYNQHLLSSLLPRTL